MNTHWLRLLTWAGYWNQGNKLSWYPNAWASQDAYAIYTDPNNALYAELIQQHPDWILKDASGSRLYIPWGCSGGTCPQYAANLTDPNGFRAWWISQAAAFFSQSPAYKGLYIDDVDMDLSRVTDGNGNPVAPLDPTTNQTMTNEAWRGYFADFMAQVRAAFPGVEIVHNALWFWDWTDSNIQREIRAADWVNLERGVNDAGLTGGQGYWSLSRFLSYIDNVHANGKAVTLDGEAPLSASDTAREYSVANYLLISTGRDLVGDTSQTPSNWWAGFDTDLGAAKAGRYTWQNLWRRDFQGGMALVNPPGSSTVTVTLPAPFTRVDGSVVNSVTLNAGEGAVLSSQLAVSSLACSPSTLSSGAASRCTVTLTAPAPGGGASVSLSSNSSLLTVPGSVNVTQGSNSATFNAQAGTVTSNQSVTVTATLNGASRTAILNLGTAASLASFTCNPTTLHSGGASTCTVTLTAAAPGGGASVALSSGTSRLSVPSSVVVPGGSTSANFAVQAGTLSSPQTATVTARARNSLRVTFQLAP